jgi:hypothetical protein
MGSRPSSSRHNPHRPHHQQQQQLYPASATATLATVTATGPTLNHTNTNPNLNHQNSSEKDIANNTNNALHKSYSVPNSQRNSYKNLTSSGPMNPSTPPQRVQSIHKSFNNPTSGDIPAVLGESRANLRHHRNSIAQYIDNERRHKADWELYLAQKKKTQENSNDLQSSTLIYLPRGGVYVQTPTGPIQFGMPPETIKDSMKLGLTLPVNYVVPKERFNLTLGINVAEFEFPAYFNFFVKRRKINLIVSREVEPLIRTVFQQTLLGPTHIPWPEEYTEKVPKDCYPDLIKEMSFFKVNPFDKTPLTVDSLLQFSYFDNKGICNLPGTLTMS